MAEKFYRNQNAHERVARLNGLCDKVVEVDDRVEFLEQTGIPDGGAATPAYDPGDLSVYYENGKA